MVDKVHHTQTNSYAHLKQLHKHIWIHNMMMIYDDDDIRLIKIFITAMIILLLLTSRHNHNY